MGSCISMVDIGRRTQLHRKYNQSPIDLSAVNPSSFPTLFFKAIITHLKLKWCKTYHSVGIQIKFGSHIQFDIEPKWLIEQTARWDIYQQFKFKATEYQLKKEFLQMTFVDQHHKKIGFIRINLYLLAIGPYHQDFLIELDKSEGARLSFNMKISQQIAIKLTVNDVQFIPKEKEFPGDIFAFSLRSIMGGRIEETEQSYKYLIDFYNSQTKERTGRNSYNQGQTVDMVQLNHFKSDFLPGFKKDNIVSPRQISGNVQDKINNKTGVKQIRWSIRQCQLMPFIQTKAFLCDLHDASFSLVFYTLDSKQLQFSSEGFFSFNKLVNFQCSERKDSQSLISFEQRNVTIKVKTLQHQKEAGQAKFNITFSLQTHLKQMQVCVRTESGILQSSPAFNQLQTVSVMPDQIAQLERLDNQIQNYFILAFQSNYAVKHSWIYEVMKRLNKQKELLKCSDKESICMFLYKNEEALLKSQKLLVQLGKRIIHLIEENIQQITPKCWQLLVVLVKRGELSLAYMGFSPEQIAMCLKGNLRQFLKDKKQIALSYYMLLVELLQRALKSLENNSCHTQKQFAQIFCAYAYFRLPKFRNVVLTAITRADDPEISEWRGSEFSLSGEQTESIPEEKTSFNLMFDWQSSFYKTIEKDQSYIKADAKLVKMMEKHGWEKRIKKRGGAYFSLITYWISYIETIVVNSKNITWMYFPGYRKILQSFLAEMKIRSITSYSDIMKKAAASLLSNEKLLNPFVLIIFRKTNYNDQPAVLKALDLISFFLVNIENRERTLPTNFDLKLLLKGMVSILEGEASYPIGKVLLLFYEHFKIFPVQFRVELSNYFLTKIFFRLFLHWSYNVRTIFHHLLFVRIYHQASKPLVQQNARDQEVYTLNPQFRTKIAQHYCRLMVILQNAKRAHKQYAAKTNGNNNHLLHTILSKKLSQKRSKQRANIIKTKAQIQYHRKKSSLNEGDLLNELVPLQQCQTAYLQASLGQYQDINHIFIRQVESNMKALPSVKFQVSLDQKQIRPDALASSQQW